MNNTMQLYIDEKKEIKGYPITSPDRVIDENGVNIRQQLDTIESEVEENYYKKDSVNTMVNSKVTRGEARENTSVKPINHTEFDTETKALFTGGAVAVVGTNSVGTENLKDDAVTSNKRTNSGVNVKISSLSATPIKLDVVNKKIILPSSNFNLIYYNNSFDNLASDLEIDVRGNGTTCSLYYDTISKSFKTFENDALNDNCVLIGTVFWNNADGSYINSNLCFDYVLKNNDELNHKIIGRISNNFIYPQGKDVRIFSENPLDIDLVNRKLVINKSGYCKILINGYLRDVVEDKIDISINDYHVSILYDASTNTLKSGLVYDYETSTTKNNYLLGIIDIKNPYLSTINCHYTVNGISHDQYLLSQCINKRCYRKKIGCLGDSITFGAGGTTWVTKLVELTGCKEAINYGYSGTTIQDNGSGICFIDRYPNMDSDLDLICVWGGVNDHHWVDGNGRDFGDINTSSSRIDTFYGALKNLCEGLLNKYPNKTIMFITPMKNKGYVAGNKTCPAWNEVNGIGKTLTDYRNAILEVCDFYSIPVLDLYSCSNISPENEAQVQNLMPDRLHPNTKGNLEILAPKIASFMNNL